MMITRRTFVRGLLATSAVAAGGTLLLDYGANTHELDVPVVRLSLGLSNPLRMVVLGDIHFDPVRDEAYMDHVAQSITRLQPDLVVYTGDFVSHRVTRVYDLARLLAKAVSRYGSFAALGNHDYWAGVEAVKHALEKNGVRILRNQSFALPDQEACFLTGLDSFWAGYPDLSVFSRTPKNSRHIVVAHEPDSFSLMNGDPRVRLQVSGHTHGGQIRVPVIGPLLLPKWGKHYPEGLFQQRDSYLYVNRGVGTLFPHIRCYCPPELTLFQLS